jgi:uncharacterized SAM-binding protein YcdF (DUF218 family)
MKYFLFRFLLIVITLWCSGFLYFIYYVQNINNNIGPASAIVVLTGGAGRIDKGIELLLEHRAPRMLISGVGKNTNLYALDEVSKQFDKGIIESLKDKIDLGYKADTTRNNAYETKEWLTKHNIDNFILVTSDYHMPRSLIKFKSIMPEYKIYKSPVEFNGFTTGDIMKKYKLYFLEYNKLIVNLFY